MHSNRKSEGEKSSVEASVTEQLPLKVLFVPMANHLFPNAGDGTYESRQEREAYNFGAMHYRSWAVRTFEALIQTFIDLHFPVSEMKIMELVHRLGDWEWRSEHRGQIVICRFHDDTLLFQLWEELRTRGVGPDQVSLTRFMLDQKNVAIAVSLDEQFETELASEESGPTNANVARLTGSSTNG